MAEPARIGKTQVRGGIAVVDLPLIGRAATGGRPTVDFLRDGPFEE